MLPLAALAPHKSGLRGVFCDIDDTLTHDGVLVPEAFAALTRAKAAGLRVVPVTGRPAGWAAVIAATWPVDAAIGENGAIYFTREARVFWDSDEARALCRSRLDKIAADVLTHVPRARLANDQWLRLCDLAFDIGEFQTLEPDEVADICARIEAGGARSTISTVHAHAILGSWDKAQMSRRVAHDLFHEELDATREHYLFVGDSPNDQAAFAYFPVSAGVSNVTRYLDRLAPPPAFVATRPGGHGFAEILDAILS